MALEFHNVFNGIYYPGDHDITVVDTEPTPPAGDTTAPATPATPTPTVGNGQITLNWADNAEGDLYQYRIYQATASGGPYTQIATTTTSDYIATDLTNGTAYWFKVTAVDTSGNESAQSAFATGTPAGGSAPAAPTGLVATAGDTEVVLDWNNNGEGNLAYYRVYRAEVTGGPYTLVGSPTASAFTATGLVNGTEYFFVVTAVNTNNDESAESAEDSDTPTGAAPDVTAPATPTSLSGAAQAGQVVLNWADNGEADLDRYGVYRATSMSGTYTLIASPTASAYTDTAVAASTSYFYKVSAFDDSDNESALTASVGPFTPTAVVQPPTGSDGYPVYADRQYTINVGTDIDTALASIPAGSIIGFAAGVHLFNSDSAKFTPRVGDRYVGEVDSNGWPTTIFRGNWNQTQFGTGVVSPFNQPPSPLASGVQLLRIQVDRFASPIGGCAINEPLNWTIHRCIIRDNKSGGVRIWSGCTLRYSKVLHNGSLGLSTHENAVGGTVDNCEIATNNFAHWVDWNWEGGGMKFFTNATNMTVKNSHYHHNGGPGIWWDFGGGGGLVENNLSEYNEGPGIQWELNTGGALIRNNVIRYNGAAADIYISNSRGSSASSPIIIEDNHVYNHATLGNTTHSTIWLKDDPARSPRLGYVTIRRNTIRRASRSGAVNTAIGIFGTAPTVAPGIVINDNDYYTSITQAWQSTNAEQINFATWQARGYDTIGTTQAYVPGP